MPIVMKFLIFLGVVALIGIVIFAPSGLGARAARRVIFQPPVEAHAVALDGLAQGGDVVTVRTTDGLDLKGIAYRGDPAKPVLLQFHGNAMTAQQAADWFRPLIAAGYGMIFAEYRGYSGNPGNPSEKGTAQDAAAWSDLVYRMAAASNPARRVYYVGHSLGGGVAFQAAQHRSPGALVTIGTFADIPNLAPSGAGWLIADRYDNRGQIAGLKSPYYILHGTADPVIPMAQSEILFAAAQAAHKPGARFLLAGEGHNPDADRIMAIIDYITAQDGEARPPAFAMSGTQMVRFGEGKP